MSPSNLTIALAATTLAFAACDAPPPEPTADKTKVPAPTSPPATQTQAPSKPPPPPKRKVNAKPTASVTPSPDDPVKGKWTLDDATKGLPAGKELVATIETSLGSLDCKLFADKAPVTVANFVGLARGLRPWKTTELTTAADLIGDYKASEARGEAKWKGTAVVITGTLGESKKDKEGKPYATLGTGAKVEVPQVQCVPKAGQEGAVGGLQEGKTTTLKGRVSGMTSMNILLSDCEVLPSGPSASSLWEKKPYYDGSIFHRIIKGFMIQGGDHLKSGAGGPGYLIPDEVWEDANHDRAGLLCTANRGPNTNGAQFFITDDAANHLDNGYTIFGACAPLDLVHKLAAVDVNGEKPRVPPEIKKISVTRKP